MMARSAMGELSRLLGWCYVRMRGSSTGSERESGAGSRKAEFVWLNHRLQAGGFQVFAFRVYRLPIFEGAEKDAIDALGRGRCDERVKPLASKLLDIAIDTLPRERDDLQIPLTRLRRDRYPRLIRRQKANVGLRYR